MKTSGLRLADSGGGAAAHTRAHNRGILADLGAKWRSPNKTHKSFKMFGSGFAPQSKRHWVGNLRPIGNRPVATLNVFSTGKASESTMTSNQLNRARVADLHMTMAGYVERGDIPGIVTLIGRGGEIHVDAIGMKTVGGKEPMRRDTIFRVASMTKPIAAAATILSIGLLASLQMPAPFCGLPLCGAGW